MYATPSPHHPSILGPIALGLHSQRDQQAAAEITEVLATEGLPLVPEAIAFLATSENTDVIFDLKEGEAFKPTRNWQPFVNFWMDWMWREKKQRNYIKLALTLQAIAARDGDKVVQADSFDTWCELAKYYQRRYFERAS